MSPESHEGPLPTFTAGRAATRDVPTDALTVIAVSALAFIASNVLHEGLGHGGACLLVGGKPLSLTAVYFDHDSAGLSDLRSRFIAAGGPIVNLVTGIIGLIALRGMKGVPGPGRYLVWLVTTLGLFMATGYLLFSGVGGIGDLAIVTKGLQPAWLWRVVLALAGAALYFVSAMVAVAEFGRIAGVPSEARVARASRIALVSYLTGAVVICAAWVESAPVARRNLPFYVEEYLACEGGPVVELGVGNGRIAIEAARRGRMRSFAPAGGWCSITWCSIPPAPSRTAFRRFARS